MVDPHVDHLLVLLLLLWSFGLQADGTNNQTESVRLVGRDSRCAGTLHMKRGEWRAVSEGNSDWTLRTAAAACRELDCGSAVSVRARLRAFTTSVWWISAECVQSGSSLRECATAGYSYFIMILKCSESVRLVKGTNLCSGRLEVKSDQSWSSVCEEDFDQQDAEVVCRELDCGAPSVLQGALYGEVEAAKWTKEFQCGGNESALLDCRSSGSDRNTCSPGRAVGLTCSDPVRLVGGESPCAGTLQVKQGEWRPMYESDPAWNLRVAAAACRELGCGSAVTVGSREEPSTRPVWWMSPFFVQSESLRDSVIPMSSSVLLKVTCSDLLHQPTISASSSKDGVFNSQPHGLQVFRGSDFTVSCSIQPQYPGGSFQLTFTSSNSTINYTQPAVNNSADFLFNAAEPAHQGSYSCVYHVHVLTHNFSSESCLLSLTVLDPTDPTPFIIRVAVLLLTLLLLNAALYFYYKASTGQKPGSQENIELDYCNHGVPGAEEAPTEEEGAQGAE